MDLGKGFQGIYPPGNESHIPYQPFGTFESMIFRTSRLVGYVSIPWKLFVFLSLNLSVI